MRINKTQYAILGALSFHEMSGYDIKRWVLEITGSFWSESPGQIYPTLSKLLKDGLIKCSEKQTKGKRLRKVYGITKKGLNVLKEWLRLQAEKTTGRNEFLLKLFLGKNISREDCIWHLKNQQQVVHDKLIRHESIRRHIEETHKKDEASFYWLLTLKRAISQENAELAWCDEAIKALKKRREKSIKKL